MSSKNRYNRGLYKKQTQLLRRLDSLSKVVHEIELETESSLSRPRAGRSSRGSRGTFNSIRNRIRARRGRLKAIAQRLKERFSSRSNVRPVDRDTDLYYRRGW